MTWSECVFRFGLHSRKRDQKKELVGFQLIKKAGSRHLNRVRNGIVSCLMKKRSKRDWRFFSLFISFFPLITCLLSSNIVKIQQGAENGLHFHSWVAHLGNQAEEYQSLFPLISIEEAGEQTQYLDYQLDQSRSNGTNDTFSINRRIAEFYEKDTTSSKHKSSNDFLRTPLPSLKIAKCVINLDEENLDTLVSNLSKKATFSSLIKPNMEFETGELRFFICICGVCKEN